jgi:UDP-N-acetylglucosamine 2-epimerase (non-hydrolysing)
MKIIAVAGARPNFVKIAPLMREMQKRPNLEVCLVHTGQHYDARMSRAFFEDLNIPRPDIDLGVGSAGHAQQTAEVMKRFDSVLEKEAPDAVLVVGDVNSTLACALTAVKRGVPVAHVEAGLRSFDRSMPEEINRVLTDAISEWLFVTERSGLENLRREGIPEAKTFFVGNVMIDTLLEHRERSEQSPILEDLGLGDKGYAVLTLHRPASVDAPEVFREIVAAITRISEELPIVFPVHPRTRKALQAAGNAGESCREGLGKDCARVRMVDPLGYLDFLKLMAHAQFVLTDSGGIQEETTVLGVPCLTLRTSTERPVTIKEGTNVLVGLEPRDIVSAGLQALKHPPVRKRLPELWDGRAAERIVNVLMSDGDIRAVGPAA